MTILPLSFFIVVVLFLFILESVRRGILETNYAIIWFVSCFVMGIVSSNKHIIQSIADTFHVYYAPSVLFLFGFLFSIIMIFDLTRRISKLTNQLINLTQSYAILKEKVENEKH